MNVGSLRDQRSKWSIHNDLQLNIRGISGVKRMEKNDNSSVRRKLLLLLMFQHFRSIWNLFRKPPSLPQTFQATVFHLSLISGRFSSGFFSPQDNIVFSGEELFNFMICLRRHGHVVRVVTYEARGPGFNSSSDQMLFFSPRV